MQNLDEERHSWLKLSIILFVLVSLGLLTYLASLLNVKINYDDADEIFKMKLEQLISVVIIFILPPILFAIFWTKKGIHYLGITRTPILSTALLAGLGMLLAMPLINWLAEMNQGMHLPEAFRGMETWMKSSEVQAGEITDAFTKGTSVGVLILNLFVIAFMAAVSEELFFRGMLQKVLIECTRNKHIGVWIGAALFSAFHMQFYGFVPRMLMGAYLGYLFVWSGSLWPGMIAHFINNGVAVFAVWLSNRGAIGVDADKIGSNDNEWVFVLTSALLVALSLVLIYRKEKKKTQETQLLNSNE
ncbi:MAG: CPBP family intramembrane glutamic endopeptidase [Bacteroidota bacterium]